MTGPTLRDFACGKCGQVETCAGCLSAMLGRPCREWRGCHPWHRCPEHRVDVDPPPVADVLDQAVTHVGQQRAAP